MAIQTRPLGRTGTNVTILGYGAMELRGQPRGPAIDDEEAGRLLNAVLDGGINLIDTSIDYGRSEELIGRYLGPPPRRVLPGVEVRLPARARRRVRRRRSRTTTAAATSGGGRAEPAQAADRPARPGAGAHVAQPRPDGGGRNGRDAAVAARGGQGPLHRDVGHPADLPDHIAMGVFDVFQIPYSAVQREHEDLITAAAAAGAGTLIRGGAARGAAAQDKDWRHGPLGLARRRRPAPLGVLRSGRPARRHEPASSSCCALRSATPAFPARSSAPPASVISAPTWPSPRKGRCQPVSTSKPSSGWPRRADLTSGITTAHRRQVVLTGSRNGQPSPTLAGPPTWPAAEPPPGQRNHAADDDFHLAAVTCPGWLVTVTGRSRHGPRGGDSAAA